MSTCRFCHNKQDVFAKYFKTYHDTKYVRCSDLFHSCTNKNCPFHYRIIEDVVSEYPTEKVYFKRLEIYNSIALDTDKKILNNNSSSTDNVAQNAGAS